MATLRIPPRARTTLVSLANFSEPEMAALKRELKDAEPTLSLTKLARRIAPAIKHTEDETLGLLAALGSLYVARIGKGETLENFSLELIEALNLKESGTEEKPLSDEQMLKFRNDIKELLSLDDSLGVTAGATSIMVELEHVWQSARILTDLRPVFGPDLGEPKADVLIHNLRIAYREGVRTNEFFVGLDSNDLRMLKDVVERALQKESSLRSRALKNGTRCLIVDAD
jgi:hypothetical protein